MHAQALSSGCATPSSARASRMRLRLRTCGAAFDGRTESVRGPPVGSGRALAVPCRRALRQRTGSWEAADRWQAHAAQARAGARERGCAPHTARARAQTVVARVGFIAAPASSWPRGITSHGTRHHRHSGLSSSSSSSDDDDDDERRAAPRCATSHSSRPRPKED
eukprot:scaffold6318_cov286-Prasinococcus_capsulatus_cf.AAC.2